MAELRDLWMRVSACAPVRKCLDALAIRVTPFYLYLEKREFADLYGLDGRYAEYETFVLKPEDVPAMAAVPGREVPEEQYREWLRKGAVCCAMMHRNEIVSFVWGKTWEGDDYFGRWVPKPTEAYLFHAFTRRDYRGKGLAPYLRWRLYCELEKRGRTDLYSYSLYSNRAAVRFKRKLKARVIGRGIHFQVLKRFHLNLQLGKNGKAALNGSLFKR